MCQIVTMCDKLAECVTNWQIKISFYLINIFLSAKIKRNWEPLHTPNLFSHKNKLIFFQLKIY